MAVEIEEASEVGAEGVLATEVDVVDLTGEVSEARLSSRFSIIHLFFLLNSSIERRFTRQRILWKTKLL